jgi:ribonucleoside-triphosphate reductase
MVSTRAKVITRRTYNRPLNDEGTVFETWEQTVARVIDHQQWLWERSLNRELEELEFAELYDLEKLMLDRKVSMSGRTLWLGGTEVSKHREASQFNCSFTNVETVYDVVDILWLLLQGCGVGFRPVVGTLSGFSKPIKDIQVIRSTRNNKGGKEYNTETWDSSTQTWTIQVGDSAEAWAKSIGKLMAGKYPAKKLILDFSQLRPAGERLKGYGWISSGDTAIAKAYVAIANILSGRADSLLTRMDILDVVNWLGTILSSRRSAEIALFEYDEPEWEELSPAQAKKFYLQRDKTIRQAKEILRSRSYFR